MRHVVAAAADRGIGETSVVETAPDALVDLFGALTYLGDPVGLLVLVTAGYLLADHLDIGTPRMAAAIAIALGGFALTLALKHAFTLPRPPGAGTDGYGFPSGHAIGATVVYGGLVGLLSPRRIRSRHYWGAAGVIALVAASRVVIGVHYLVDVFVGVGVGVAYLAVATRVGPGWTPDRVTSVAVQRTFALAVGVGLVALSIDVVLDTVIAVAAAAGGWLGWRLAGDRALEATGSTRRLVASLAFLPVVAITAGTVVEGGVSLPVAAALAGGVVALILALPGLPLWSERSAA
ncbi:PAP2 superfamily protein [Haloplanus vescus]|uniref:PAP2 superfamily protein n=1 Tax=Haloplanus vescus TaxID=555874 RepID=A0A1H3ZE70_9EURY|nr:phosphatase PAP2 family protein [Haloplanus vescus]SEA21935.1 PAP2 superfamily protein [Haloplanus vescus]